MFFAEEGSTPQAEGHPPPPPPPPNAPVATTWSALLLELQGPLLAYLYTNEVATLGAVSTAYKATFLAPGLLRASVHATGPSDSTRFQFWKKTLRVTDVQRELLLSHEGTEEQQDEAAFHVFTTVLFGGRGHSHGQQPPQQEDSDHDHPRPHQQPNEDDSHQLQQQRYSGKRMLAHDGQEGEILRDVARTFPLEPLFRDSAGAGQNLLANVLKACLTFHDDTGYMQGMNFVVASFLFSLRRRLLPPSPFNHYHPQSHRVPLHQATTTTTSEPNSSKGYFPSPPHGSGSLGDEQKQYLHRYSPSTTTDEEDGYHSDHSTQTQGSECFSPPPSTFHHPHPQCPEHDPPTPNPPQPPPSPEKKALGKRYGFWWECSDAHMHLGSEVFWMMTAVMSASSGLSMRLLWHPDVPHMKLRVFQFDRLLTHHLPRLHAHFKAINLAPDILVTQWHMTLLAYCLPLRVLVRTWDVVFQDGWKALFRITLALLQDVEDDLLSLNLEESGRFLRQWTSRRHSMWRDADSLLRASKAFKVTRTMLRELTEEFHLTLLREQMSGGNTGQWLSRYGPPADDAALLKAPELEGLKKEIRRIEGPVVCDFGYYRAKIEEASQGYELASKKVAELDARLSEAAMQVEEMEDVRRALQQQVEDLKSVQEKEGGNGEEGSTTVTTAKSTSARLLGNLLSAHRRGAVVTTPSSLGASTPSLASSLFSSIRDLGPLQRHGRSVAEEATVASAATVRARTGTEDSVGSVSSSASSSSSSSSFASARRPKSAPSSSSFSLSMAAFTPRSSEASQPQTAPEQPYHKDMCVQERKVSRTESQLATLKALFASLQLQRTEAEVALEEAEAFRTSLSTQLLHLLQDTEEKVNKRMREVVRSQPRYPHASAPLALSPNKDVLDSARRTQEARRRASSNTTTEGEEKEGL